MPFLYPDIYLESVTQITPELLKERNIKGLLLDVDNTLAVSDHPDIYGDIGEWIELMRSSDIRMIIVSNNKASRVSPFAEKIGLPYISRAAKPLPLGNFRAAKRLGVKREELAVVGDQIFTDIIGGKLAGTATIMTKLIVPETGVTFRLRRRLERPIIRKLTGE